MNPIKLVIKELLYRKISSLLILLTVIVASTVTVSVFTMSRASEDETRKIMREQGLNLYIFPKGTNLIDFYTVNNTSSFPESYVDTLAVSKTFDAVRHLTGILQVRVPEWTDSNGSSHQIMLFGYKDEATQKYLSRQETMGFDVPKGKVVLGYYVAKNVKEGDPFVITGSDGKKHSFQVSSRLQEGKGMMDQGVSFHLADLQDVIGMSGQINRIEALGCVCSDGRIKNARKQVQSIFPDLEVTELGNIADARENQRLMMNRYGAFIIPFVMIACLLITALLFYQNVMVRRQEIGLMMALGNSNSRIVFVILFKAFLLGLTGGVAGFFLGTIAAGYFGREIFKFTAMNIKPVWSFLLYCAGFFPFLWMAGSWIPAFLATKTDSARILAGE